MAPSPESRDPPPEVIGRVLECLQRAVDRTTAGGRPLALLYSGGVDSSLLARLMSPPTRTNLVTVGFPGSPDLAAARTGAATLALPWIGHELAEARVAEAARRWKPELNGASATARSVTIALALALECVEGPRVVVGQGADELFLGYSHFSGLRGAEARERRDRDLRSLQEEEWPRALRIARQLGRDLAAPYLDPDVVESVLSLPVEWHLSEPLRKPFLRGMAVRAGVPPLLAIQPKRAFQYGSRVDAALRRLDRATGTA